MALIEINPLQHDIMVAVSLGADPTTIAKDISTHEEYRYFCMAMHELGYDAVDKKTGKLIAYYKEEPDNQIGLSFDDRTLRPLPDRLIKISEFNNYVNIVHKSKRNIK